MRALLLILFPTVAFATMPLPSFTPQYSLIVTQVGENIFSGSLTTTLKTNADTVYWETNTPSGGTLPIYSVTPVASSWVNLEPDNADFDGSTITCKANGHVNLLVKYGVFDRKTSQQIYRYVATQTLPGTNYTFVTNVAGSLAYHITTNTYGRASGSTATKKGLWTTRNVASTNYVRNPNFFLADVNGIESYPAGNNSTCCQEQNGCLVSPRHVLGVQHTGSYMGMTLFFVNRTNNAVLARTVIDWMVIEGSYETTCALLNEPLPASFVPAAVLTNKIAKLPQYAINASFSRFVRVVPAVGFSQLQAPGILRWIDDNSLASFYNTTGDWSCPVYPGDSGTPVYVLVNNRLAVVSNYSTGNSLANSGGAITGLVNNLQTAMNTLCARNGFTNETLVAVDLSEFTSY